MGMRFLVIFCMLVGFAPDDSASGSSGLLMHEGSGPSKEAAPAVYSRNPEANALYIQGLEFLKAGRPWAGGSTLNARKALKLFRQAARKDPQFALAYIGQADALDSFSFSVAGNIAPAKLYPLREAAALKAAALDDSL